MAGIDQKGRQMPSKKPLVIVTRKLPDAIETRMMELFVTRLNLDDFPLSQAQLAAPVREADVLVPTVTDRIDAALLAEAGPYLRLIDSCGARRDRLDLFAARADGHPDHEA